MQTANLLIIHQGALGDFILTFPAIIRLQKYYDRIDVLCQSRLGKLAEALGLVDDWYPLEAAYVASLFTDQIDPKIKAVLKPYAQIILFTLSFQLEQTINQIAAKSSCRIPSRPPAHVGIHVTKFVLQNLITCGLLKKSDAGLDGRPIPDGVDQPSYPEIILLHPGAGSVRKRWPISNFLKVEAMLKADGLNPEFILGPAEKDLADELQQPGRSVHILDDLQDLAALLKFSGGYIGNDSGASHLAAFLGLPTAVIFGPADPRRWAPVGRAVEIVRPELECRPCFEIETTNCNNPECLDETTPQKLIKAFYRVYSVF